MDGLKINGIVERFHHTVDEMANAFLSRHGDPKFFFGNTCTVIWTGYIKLVHSGLISFPICFCQTTPFLTSFTLCFVTWVAGFNKTMDVTKGEHDLPRRIFKLWYWVHRVWPRIIDNVVLMKIPSLDVIKFAHFWYSLEEENIDYLMTLIRNITLTLSETVL